VVLAVLAFTTAGFWVSLRRGPEMAPIGSIAVLPLQNLSAVRLGLGGGRAGFPARGGTTT